MDKGIETHRWGYFDKRGKRLVATCIAETIWEAEEFFANILLTIDGNEKIEIIFKENE